MSNNEGYKLHAVTGCVGDYRDSKVATGYTCTGMGAL